MQNMTKIIILYRKASERPDDWCVLHLLLFNSCYNFIYRIRLRVIVFTNALSSQHGHSLLLFSFSFLFNLGETLLLLEMTSHVLVCSRFWFCWLCIFSLIAVQRMSVFGLFYFHYFFCVKEPPLCKTECFACCSFGL